MSSLVWEATVKHNGEKRRSLLERGINMIRVETTGRSVLNVSHDI